MRRVLAIAALVFGGLAALLIAPTAQADPLKGDVVTASCSDGTTVQVNIGVPTNASSQFFVATDASIFVIKRIVGTNPQGQVIFTKDYGIQGFARTQLITCTLVGPTSGNTFTLTGYFTPRRT
jgi:hypothetical protein